MISSPGCVCRGAVFPGRISTIAWIVSCPGMLRSCRCRSMRLVVGCCPCANCSPKIATAISTATAMIRVVVIESSFGGRLHECATHDLSVDDHSCRLLQPPRDGWTTPVQLERGLVAIDLVHEDFRVVLTGRQH